MQIHQVKPKTKRRHGKYIGRGGKRGTYSGRGIKGQKARAGRKMRPEIRDMIKKLPKKRGYRFKSFRENAVIVNLDVLNNNFADNSEITPKILAEYGFIKKLSGRVPAVKILGDGKIEKKFSVSGCLISISAKDKIERAGGYVK
jgi:large subunit ribosomal protein L15